MTQDALFEISNTQGMKALITPMGASLASLRVPLKHGGSREVVLGCASARDYAHNPCYLGASVGRVANRIRHARLLEGESAIALVANQGAHQLHSNGQLSHHMWQVQAHHRDSLSLSIRSHDGDQGFPGNLDVQVSYRISEDNTLGITYCASTDKACPVNITNHSYFNLNARHDSVLDHHLFIDAQAYLPVDAQGLPLAALADVAGSSFDFRHAKSLACDLLSDAQQRAVNGYDHSFLLNSQAVAKGEVVARLQSKDKQLSMAVLTSKPALHVYSGNFLSEALGRDNQPYQDRAGIALETQFLPDAPNRPDWPHQSCWLDVGERYQHTTAFRFY